RAGRPDPADRYPDAATMGAALADAAAQLPLPGPLTLVGTGVVIEDPHPTNLAAVAGSALFDQDAADEIEVKRAEGRRQRPWLVVTGVAVSVTVALVAAMFALLGQAAAPVVVPNFVGQNRAVAGDVAGRSGFAVRSE